MTVRRPAPSPARLRDRAERLLERICQAVQQVNAQLERRTLAEQERDASALARRRRSEAGEPVVGRIPEGPHRLVEAEAHLAREIAVHQAKLDHRAAVVAAGKRPMGRPPVPMEHSSRVLRARRVVAAAIAANTKAASEAASNSNTDRPSVVANTTDPQSRIMQPARVSCRDTTRR